MLVRMRVQVTTVPDLGDGRAHALVRRLEKVGFTVAECSVADVYLVAGVPALTASLARELFCDPVAQVAQIDGDLAPHEAGADGGASSRWDALVEVGYKPGVADPVASSIRDALGSEFDGLPAEAIVQT